MKYKEDLKKILEEVLNQELKIDLKKSTSLRNDLGLDSLKLAQLTVFIEDEFGVDVFEDGIVETVDDIIKKIEND